MSRDASELPAPICMTTPTSVRKSKPPSATGQNHCPPRRRRRSQSKRCWQICVGHGSSQPNWRARTDDLEKNPTSHGFQRVSIGTRQKFPRTGHPTPRTACSIATHLVYFCNPQRPSPLSHKQVHDPCTQNVSHIAYLCHRARRQHLKTKNLKFECPPLTSLPFDSPWMFLLSTTKRFGIVQKHIYPGVDNDNDNDTLKESIQHSLVPGLTGVSGGVMTP